jgi:hypothetical protein
MAANQSPRGKKYFTVAEANATLPLVRAIARDITALHNDLRERYERLARARHERGTLTDAYQEEWDRAQEEFERDQDRLQEYVDELHRLGVLLKDPNTGLLDFPCWKEGREVYLCWRLGEPEVAYWHEIDAGFAGRQKLEAATVKR